MRRPNLVRRALSLRSQAQTRQLQVSYPTSAPTLNVLLQGKWSFSSTIGALTLK